MSLYKFISFFVLLSFIGLSCVQADDTEASDKSDDDEFSVMNTLSAHNLHNIKDERWNIYSQATYISSVKDAFPAAYTNLNGTPNSLTPNAERSFTATATFYLGLKAWQGGEFYVAPEMISELPLSGLKGIGGSIYNFELQKMGQKVPLGIYLEHFIGRPLL